MSNNFAFLQSTRFWALILGAVAYYLQSKGFIGEAEMILVATITAGFTTIRTIDRASEQKVFAAGVTTGQVLAEDVTDVPPQE